MNENKENTTLEQMNVVVIGHVDHGKSTVVGRLLADTDSLPSGKLEDIKTRCAANSRPFEYAFLLDALKDEQAQGITIDSARCFFKSSRRKYIIIDAPGHIEFLKNMISGAARAEAAVLVIDAKEGVQENSRRHGYLLSMLGITQVAVCVNKMDLAGYNREVFESIKAEYSAFLAEIGIKAEQFIPASAREGDCIVGRSDKMSWYEGPSILETMDLFRKEPAPEDKPFRLPIQDVYKFTAQGDDRRIFAGRIETGSFKVGDDVVFLPSGKETKVKTIENFNRPPQKKAAAGESTGFTIEQQFYILPGEVVCRRDEAPALVGRQVRVNIFWMGRQPMIPNKKYKLKIGTARIPVWLREIVNVLDASELTTDSNRTQIERHDVAECVLETIKPVAFDLSSEIARTGRFVIIDNYEIAGGGVVLSRADAGSSLISEHVTRREKHWERSSITPALRASRYNQKSTLVVISGRAGLGKQKIAKALEENLFAGGRFVYYLGLSNSLLGIDMDIAGQEERDESIRRLGEISHLFTDAGMILITTVSDLQAYELEIIAELNRPNDFRIVNIGDNLLSDSGVDLQIDEGTATEVVVEEIKALLREQKYLIEYYL
ncbi:MAG: GTP-binding protein [Phycisphaerae bacterium]|jgi:bifunctional enzyme CysN/CysC